MAAIDKIARTYLTEIDCNISNLSALRTELNRVVGSYSRGTVANRKVIETLALRLHG